MISPRLFLICFCLALTTAHAAVPLGGILPNLEFRDIRAANRSLTDLGPFKACVILFTTKDCPLVARSLPKMQELHEEFASQGVVFLALNEGPDDSLAEVAYQAIEFRCEFPFGKDPTGSVARAVGIDRTPGVVVLDAERKLRYRGRIDDQLRLTGSKPVATQANLRMALDQILAGRPIDTPETPVEGCLITFPDSSVAQATVTFAADIEPILRRQCVECHRPGTEAPFPLVTYEQVASKARMIQEVVDTGTMPPWFAHPAYGEFKNERRLTAQEKTAIRSWVQQGKPAGDLASIPPPLAFPDSKWLIGEPDLVVTALKDEVIPATGYVDYRYVILPKIFTQDTWLEGIQIQPGNPRVVHHANLAYVILPASFSESEGFLTGRVPGGMPVKLDPGVAMLIPKGSVLGLQIHYVTTGKEERDRIAVGLRYARGVIQKRVRYQLMADYRFAIPPGAPAHPVAATRELDCDATGIGLFQHMHLRGKDTTFTARYPDGREQIVLAIPNYNFGWQLGYIWKDGTQKFPKGTRLECRSHFDNSPFNPFNPDPKATVRNGPQTHHEMMQGFLFYTDDAEQLGLEIDEKTGFEKRKKAQLP